MAGRFFTVFTVKESFGPREENSSLKGPLLNHLTSERTKHNFSYILMLQASCIYLGLNSTSRNLPPPPPAHLPSCKCYLNRGILKSLLIDVSLIASTNLPIRMKPLWSLSALSLVAPPCLNKCNLLLLRSSFLFCLAGTVPYILHKGSPSNFEVGSHRGSDGKKSAAVQEIQVWSLAGKIPWRREWQPTLVFLPGEFHR